jgi:hypothetical protein
MLRTTLFLASVIALLLVIPSAAASFSITVTPPESPPAPVREGGSTTLNFGIAIENTGDFICAEGYEVVVKLEATGVDPGKFEADPSAEEITFNIGAGAHLTTAEQGWSDSGSASLQVRIIEIPQGHPDVHTFGLKASIVSDPPETCQPASAFNKPNDEASFDVPVVVPAPEDEDNENGGTGPNGTDPDAEESPFFPPMALVIGIALYAALRRRSA